MAGKIYITFNSSNKTQIEESTALRLQTLSNLYGINVNLPYRANLKFDLDSESKTRIKCSDYVIVLSMTNLSPRLKEEIDFSISEKKPIIVIYNEAKGKNIKFLNKHNIKEVSLDAYNSEETLHKIAQYLQKELKSKSIATKLPAKKTITPTLKKATSPSIKNEDAGLGIALLGIGLGLLSLALLSNDEKR